MNKPDKINLKEKFSKFSEHWSPKVIAKMNNYQFKLVKIKNEFIWHKHKNMDEVFIVIAGNMKIEFRDSVIDLSEGEMFVVPKGVEHKPYSKDECKVMIVEPKDVVNTGNSPKSELTSENDIWI